MGHGLATYEYQMGIQALGATKKKPAGLIDWRAFSKVLVLTKSWHNYGKSPFLIGKSTTSMGHGFIFWVDLKEGRRQRDSRNWCCNRHDAGIVAICRRIIVLT
jgi:hypothetical protein